MGALSLRVFVKNNRVTTSPQDLSPTLLGRLVIFFRFRLVLGGEWRHVESRKETGNVPWCGALGEGVGEQNAVVNYGFTYIRLRGARWLQSSDGLRTAALGCDWLSGIFGGLLLQCVVIVTDLQRCPKDVRRSVIACHGR